VTDVSAVASFLPRDPVQMIVDEIKCYAQQLKILEAIFFPSP
jgi:hypothetical protein